MAAKRLLVIPEFNESRTILAVLERALPHVDRIVVVDDGSTDDSGQLIREFAAAHPQLVLLAHRHNQGMSGALLTGFAYAWHLLHWGWLAPTDWIVTIDADGQHRPEEIPDLIVAAVDREADVLLTRRDFRGYPRYKRVGNWGLSLWASWLSGHRYHDVECGFRAFRAEVLTDLIRYFTGRRYGCAQEIGIITARLGWQIDNTLPTDITYYRPGARVRDGVINLWMGFLAWWRVSWQRTYPVPERVHAVLGEAEAVVVPDYLPLTVRTPWIPS